MCPAELLQGFAQANLKTSYNRLETQVEYIADGKVKTTNLLKRPVTVEKCAKVR